jgi:hypothetical protein
MRRSPEEIMQILTERRSRAHPWQSRAEEVRLTYNGDIAVPLPELDEVERAAVANLVQTGLDGLSKRTASTRPDIYYPPLRAGIQTEMKAARKRKAVTIGWWEQNRLNLKLRKRALHLLGYGTSPVLLRPDMDGTPCWYVRDPLTSFPGPRLNDDEMVPPDCVFLTKRTRAQLERDYPVQMARLNKGNYSVFDQIEYVSADQLTTFVKGADPDAYSRSSGTTYEVFHDLDNRTGRPWVVVPGRITLDRIIGKFDGMVGMYMLQAKMNALFMNAVQRSIFPDTWIVSANGQANVITQADGIQGIVGRVEGGDIKILQSNPGQYTPIAVDRLEAAARDTGTVPSELSGRSGTNIRTDKRGNSVLAAAIDFDIQEAQEILEESLKQEDYIAIAIAKDYNGSKTLSLYVEGTGQVDYNPTELFTTDVHQVRYAYAGADAEQLGVLGAQKVGAGLMSRQTAMEMDPAIKDAQIEMERIEAEGARQALLMATQTMAQDPNSPVPPSSFADFIRNIAQDKMPIEDAWLKMHEDLQKQQAAAQQAAAQPQPGVAPGPQQQPGANALPDQLAGIPAVTPSMDHLSQLVRAATRTQGAPG